MKTVYIIPKYNTIPSLRNVLKPDKGFGFFFFLSTISSLLRRISEELDVATTVFSRNI